MKKNIKYFVSFLFVSLLFTVSCVKDDGNYDYTELPKMEIADYSITANNEAISLLDDNTVFIGKNNHVVLTPNYVMDKEINAKYVWSIMPKEQPASPASPIPADTIGTEAALDYVFKQIPGKYVLVLEVYNDAAGTNFKNIVKFNLIIEAVNGIGVLHSRAGKGDISVFKTNEIDANVPADGYTMKSDVISFLNGGMLLNNPSFIDCDYDTKNKYNIGTSDGVSTFDIEFTYVSNNELKYAVATPAPSPALPQSIFSSDPSTTFSFMVMNNKLWARTGKKAMMCTNLMYRFNNNDYHPFILINDNYAGHIAFNKTSKGFEYLRQGSGLIEAPWIGTNPNHPQLIIPSGEVSINDTKMDAIAFGHSANKMLAIMKDASSQLHAVRFTYPESKDGKPVAACELNNNLSGLVGMSESVVWEFGTRGQYAFYGSGNNLYVYNSDKNTSYNANLGIPSDEKINRISILTYRKSDIGTGDKKDDYKEKRNGSVIFIATLKNGVGKIYQFTINPSNGRPDITSKKVITGFGEIKDIKLIR